MKRIIRLSPAEYINEKGILKRLSALVIERKFYKPVVLTDQIVKKVIIPYIEENLLKQWSVELFKGNCTFEEISRLTNVLKEYDVIIAFGGGQLLDTAKCVADNLGIGLINVPTVPSNCACATTKSIVYSEKHEMIESVRHYRSVDLVLVEPQLLKKAPYKYILSGIGDTLAKFYEIRHRLKIRESDLVSRQISFDFINICKKEILKITNIENLEGKELQNFLDTILLVAASVDGFADQDGRSVGAHTFYNAYVYTKKNYIKTHGEIVGVGILFQLLLEGEKANDSLRELQLYYKKIGLAKSLKEIGIERADFSKIAKYVIRKDNTRMQSIFPDISSNRVIKALEKLER